VGAGFPGAEYARPVVSPPQLSLSHRLLHAAGGRVTEILEGFSGAAVEAEKLAELPRVLDGDLRALDAPAGTLILDRRVLLRASPGGMPLLYAASLILPARLPPEVVRALLATNAPIGSVLREHRIAPGLEVYATFAGSTAEYRDLIGSLADGDAMLGRSYRLLVDGSPAMLIRERFPARPRA
jgi:chorismate-pyruvate lyase